jgi:hypothetical protein
MLSVTIKPNMPSVIIVSVVVLSVEAPKIYDDGKLSFFVSFPFFHLYGNQGTYSQHFIFFATYELD